MTNDIQQPLKVKTTSGVTVEISLEEWIKSIIEHALQAHQLSCPLNQHVIDASLIREKENVHNRLSKVEWQLTLIKWLGSAVGVASIAHMVSTVAKVFSQ